MSEPMSDERLADIRARIEADRRAYFPGDERVGPDESDDLLAGVDYLRAALDRVKVLHRESHPGEYGSACKECAVTYPCATIRALEGETDE